MIDQQQLLSASEADYMNAEQLAFFENLLQELKITTQGHIEEARQNLAHPPELNDEGDRAQYEEIARISLRIVDRERKLLPKIDEALKRIRKGEYGYCQESGEPIGIQRLLLRPTAEYCADIKALKEKKEQGYAH